MIKQGAFDTVVWNENLAEITRFLIQTNAYIHTLTHTHRHTHIHTHRHTHTHTHTHTLTHTLTFSPLILIPTDGQIANITKTE
jgi:hypothetical protein